MSFADIFKSSFLRNYSFADLSIRSIVMSIGLCCIFALYLFFVYRLVTRKTVYDKNMNISLAVISVIVCGIVLTIQSSIVVSLGMVGALSIVRFRTAIKNPMDLVFLFWSISIGIICGAGLPGIAVIVSVAVTGGIVFFSLLPVAKAPMLLIVNASEPSARPDILDAVQKNTSAYTVKSQTIEKNRLDMVIEVRMKSDTDLICAVSSVVSVTRSSLVSHDGEVTF